MPFSPDGLQKMVDFGGYGRQRIGNTKAISAPKIEQNVATRAEKDRKFDANTLIYL